MAGRWPCFVIGLGAGTWVDFCSGWNERCGDVFLCVRVGDTLLKIYEEQGAVFDRRRQVAAFLEIPIRLVSLFRSIYWGSRALAHFCRTVACRNILDARAGLSHR